VKTLEVLDKVLRGKRVRPETQRHYRDALGSLARYSEDWPVNGVVINEWLGSLKGYSDMTVRNWFNFVNSAGKYMKKAYKLDNPCEDADRPRVSKKRRRYFTAEELARIIKACRFEQDLALVLTLIDSTCRIGELAGLEVKDVGDGWIDVRGKTGQRRYRCDVRICRELRRLGDGGEPIFRGRDGRQASVVSLKHRVRRVIKEAGITGSKLGAHTLRHSGASLVAQETGSALAVKALLQHDKIDTSMEYIHDAEDVIQQRISPLGLVLAKVQGDVPFESLQLTMGGEVVEDKASTAVVPVEGEIVEVVDLVDDMFPEIKDGVEVRSVFKTDDLRLIRRAFIGYVRSGHARSDELKLRLLLKRMLRKVGR
jgi:integrase